MLRVHGLHFRYPDTAVLAGIDLALEVGEIVSIVGPNGTGKSTLLKCINGILQPTTGEIAVAGRSTRDYSRRELARTVAYVPQQTGGMLSLPVVDMIGLGRAPHRASSTRAHDRDVVMNAIQQLKLDALAFRMFGELSGGERQRVLIARALAQEGRLMLLDEPTSSLDMRHQLETMTTVRDIVKNRAVGALIAIHDLALASRFSDRLIMLSRGQVHAAGSWDTVLSSAHLQAVYGVGAIVGTDQSLPYVIPTQSGVSQ